MGILHPDAVREHIERLKEKLADAEPGSAEAVALQSQIATLENEIDEEPIIAPLFGFHPHGGHEHHGGGPSHGGSGARAH